VMVARERDQGGVALHSTTLGCSVVRAVLGQLTPSTRLRPRPPQPHPSRPRGSERRARRSRSTRVAARQVARARGRGQARACSRPTRVRDRECRKRERARDLLSARHDVDCLRRTHYSPPAKALLVCVSKYRFRFRWVAPVVRPMSAALNGSGRRKTASRSADEQHR
jgi:hypothetical protein